MKYSLVCLSFSLLCLVQPGWGQQPVPARKLLDDALTQLDTEDAWKSKAVGDDLKEIVDKHKGSQEYTTAEALYGGYLMEQGGAHDAEALAISNAVISQKPQGWQAVIALLNKATILGFEKKHQDAVAVAKQGLQLLDQVSINQINDPDFARMLAATHSGRSDIKDGFLTVIATRLIDLGKSKEANEYTGQINNQAIRDSVARARQLKDGK